MVCDDIDMMKMREFSDINQLQFNTRDRSLLQNWNIHSPHDILGPKDQMTAFQFHYQHTSRSLSVIGVLGGIVLILFFVALSTCIKHRRNLNAFGDRYHQRENLAREMLVDHLRQLRSNHRSGHHRTMDRPPSYDDVVKTSEEDTNEADLEPPSYIEATNSIVEAPEAAEAQEENSVSTVVTVETRPSST